MSSADPQIMPAQAPASPRRTRKRPLATLRTITALVLREMSTRYGATPGGYAWAVLEPLGMIIVLSFAFSLLLRTPSLGSSFILFYATGYLPFNLYQNLTNMIMRSIRFSKPLLGYPAVTWMDAVLARFVLNSLTSILVSYLLLVGIMIVTDTRTVLDMGPIVLAMGLAMLLGLGSGAMNCLLVGLFPAWEQIWSIIMRPLFLASGIIFILEDLPPGTQDILWYNPLVHITGLMRTGFYPMYSPNYISVTYVASVSLIALALGFIMLGRYHQDILNR